MSSMTYISADCPIPEVQNPHERFFSINEALELGLEVSKYLLQSNIDRDWKNAIHWSDRDINFDIDHGIIEDGDHDDDFAILPIRTGSSDIHSCLKYQSRIECIWSVGRAKKIMALLASLLDTTEVVEFWQIYMDNGRKPKIIYYDARINELTPDDLIEISNLPTYKNSTIHHCVRISK